MKSQGLLIVTIIVLCGMLIGCFQLKQENSIVPPTNTPLSNEQIEKDISPFLSREEAINICIPYVEKKLPELEEALGNHYVIKAGPSTTWSPSMKIVLDKDYHAAEIWRVEFVFPVEFTVVQEELICVIVVLLDARTGEFVAMFTSE
ncbi:hypothetical protein LJC20_07390 [Eubacteriales bacterium OttesenSCG-928-M02]|nr:hypothetical protein [Eubacteriales bacterium OttesenSCG-928-M02]